MAVNYDKYIIDSKIEDYEASRIAAKAIDDSIVIEETVKYLHKNGYLKIDSKANIDYLIGRCIIALT